MSLFCITFNSLGQLDGLQVGQYKKDNYKEKRIDRQPKSLYVDGKYRQLIVRQIASDDTVLLIMIPE